MLRYLLKSTSERNAQLHLTQTQRLRKMDFLTEKCNGEKEGFQKHESSDSHMEAVERYVTEPATVIDDVGDFLSNDMH